MGDSEWKGTKTYDLKEEELITKCLEAMGFYDNHEQKESQ